MDMTPNEIVVRYRQAKEKGKQLNILADLNACSVDDIVHVGVEHGGYKLERMSRSRGTAKLLKEGVPKKSYKKPEIIPEPLSLRPKEEPNEEPTEYIVPVKSVPDQAVMIVNEEGVLRGMSPNPSASLTAGRPIFGNALVVGVNGDEFTDIPDDVLKCIRALIGGYKP